MRVNDLRSWPPSFLLWLPTVLLLGACGSASGEATPTMGPDAIFTSAAQTFEAQVATELALVTPSSTAAPSPSPLPTLASIPTLPTVAFAASTPLTAASGNCDDDAAFTADVTIPDNTQLDPSRAFVKTWKMYNSGSCTWTTKYKLVHLRGNAFSGSTAFIGIPVPPGGTADISVNMVSPSEGGSYYGTWRMQNADNKPFGSEVTVVIKIGVAEIVETETTAP